MPEMFSWYIDNRFYITEEFVKKLVAYSQEASQEEIALREVFIRHEPDAGNPSSPITFARNVGLLNADEELSDSTRLYQYGFLPFENLLFELISKRNVAKINDIKMKPVVILSIVFSIMDNLGVENDEKFITAAECYEYLSVLSSYDEIDDTLINTIISDREYSGRNHIPQKRVEVKSEVYFSSIFNALCKSEIFVEGLQKSIIQPNLKYMELIQYIAEVGKNISIAPSTTGGRENADFYTYCSNINNGILEIIPRVPFKNAEIDDADTQNIYNYLFGVGHPQSSIRQKYFTDDCFGTFRIFYPIQWLAISKVYLQDTHLGENLFAFAKQHAPYSAKLKENRLMIEIPFSNRTPATLSELTQNNEQRFKAWLYTVKKTNGENYKENAISQYLSAFRSAAKEFADIIAPYTSFFSISNADDFETIFALVQDDERYTAFNDEKGNGAFSACSKLYLKFLSSIAEQYIFTPEWFKEKAADYPSLDDEAAALLTQFQDRFSVEYLSSLSGVELLHNIFLNNVNANNLCRVLEFDSKNREIFGSISGGTAYKYGLYYASSGTWMTGSSRKAQPLSEEDAIVLGTKIRDRLVAGAKAIADYDELKTIDDYKALYEKLLIATEGDIDKVWFMKYYQMLYPQFFATNYSDFAQRTILGAIGEEKEKYAFVRLGQLRFFADKCGISNVMLNKIFWQYYSEEDTVEEKKETSQDISFHTGYTTHFARNRILFGAPGTGKSYTINKEKNELLENGGEYERVTFHPDYSYANFVGTYKPVPFIDNDGKDAITYAYVPGPFMRTYVKALKNSRTPNAKPFLVIIEEINRANVAAVFGDVFQLLDRDEEEKSEYPIQATEDIKKYLAEELGGTPADYAEIRIPDNMFIWATMNSADQGVFPMDTAFKRRWDFTYLGIDDSEEGIAGKMVTLGKGSYERNVEWNELRRAINEELLTYKVNEDKLMGPYFISKKIMPEDTQIDADTFIRVFKNKVIMYLFDDAAKQKRHSLFAGCDEKTRTQYSKICAEFDRRGVAIFCAAIKDRFIPEEQGEG